MNRMERVLFVVVTMTFIVLIFSLANADPVLLDSQTTNNGDGTQTFMSQSGGWWQDDAGNIQRTDSSLQTSDGIWDIENTSAPHKVYAALDEVRWRVDPPAGEAAGFEIAFATVSLYMFDEVNGDVEKTINWARTALDGTEVTTSTVSYPLFASCSLYVISTPEGYKTNFYVADPASIPDPQSVEYFGATADLSKVYFSARYSVSKWPDSVMSVDGVEYGPGAIVDGYSAEFGDDLWMLPTKAYRNVKDFNGQSFHDAEDESYVYYVFDRLAQEILVLAPYALFVGADNVVIDPTTWTSGRTSSDDANWTASNAATSNFSTDNYVQIGYNSSYERHGLFRFSSIPSVPNVTNVSATLMLFYDGTQSPGGTTPIKISKLLKPWVEGQSTFNIYSTGNNWDTAGPNNVTTDFEGSTSISYSWADASNIVLSNTTSLNLWCEEWIEGSFTNNGIHLFRDGSTTTDIKQVWSDDYATASGRPYLAITYTSASSLASLSDDAVSVDVFPGSIVASITILDTTTASVFIADLIPDVSLDLVLEDTTHLVVGAGADADENWDAYTAVDLIGGGSMFVLVSNYTLTQAAGCALYFESSLTGYAETRSFSLSPAGSGGETGIADRIDSATALLVTRFDTVDSSITNASTAIQAQLDDVETTQSSHTSTLSDVSTRMKAVEADAVWTVFTNTLINGATSTYNASPGYCYVPAGYPAGYAKQSTVGGATDTLKFVFLSWVNMGSETEAVYTPAAKFEVDYGAWTVVGDIVTSATEADVVRGTLQSTDILQYATGKF